MRFRGRFAQRRSLDGVQRTLIGAAVLLEPALEENGEGRFAPRWRPKQQQQPSSDVRSGGRGLEVIDHPPQRLIDAEQLALEELAGLLDVVALGSRGRARAACPRCIRDWCECKSPGSSAKYLFRKSLRVPSQRCARCSLLKRSRESTKSEGLDPSFSCDTPIVKPPLEKFGLKATSRHFDALDCSKKQVVRVERDRFNSIRNVLC